MGILRHLLRRGRVVCKDRRLGDRRRSSLDLLERERAHQREIEEAKREIYHLQQEVESIRRGE